MAKHLKVIANSQCNHLNPNIWTLRKLLWALSIEQKECFMNVPEVLSWPYLINSAEYVHFLFKQTCSLGY